MSGVKNKKEKTELSAEKKRKKDKEYEVDQFNIKADKLERGNLENYENRLTGKKKRRKNKPGGTDTAVDELRFEAEDGSGEQNRVANDAQENEKRKSRKKKRKNEKKARADNSVNEAEDNSEQQKDHERIRSGHSETQGKMESYEGPNETDGTSTRHTKSDKARKKKNNHTLSKNEENLLDERDSQEDDVFQISSGDEDFSKGMKRWIIEYHQRRPGLNILQQRIDDYITAHEAREEEERKEREAQAAEDGWTVVVHHKGRKKTTDAETGVVVGSVAQAAVQDKMAKKKNKTAGLDFYRFQRREARRNEIMMLQNKFEQDKKRIQQMRAARKFRPY